MIAHLPALRRYAIGLSGSVVAGEDLVQDCLEHALRRLGTLQDEAKMSAWLRGIMFNAFIDERRRWRGRVETLKQEESEAIVDRAVRPDVREELEQTLRAAASLTPHHSQILLLVAVEGLTYREAAEELGVPIGTVMSRLARAREQLNGALSSPRPPAPGGQS